MRPRMMKLARRLALVAMLASLGASVAVMTGHASVASSDTGTTATSTTSTTTTGTGLPAPYNKAPWLVCSGYSSPIEPLSRSKVRSFTIYVQCHGLAKQGYIQLVKLPRGWSFIGQGTYEYFVTSNRVGKRPRWERRTYRMIAGVPTLAMVDLTTWRFHKQVGWVAAWHIRLNRSSPLGRRYFTYQQHVQNGSLTKDYTQNDYYTIAK